MSADSLLSVRDLKVSYGHIEAVRGIDLDVGAGEFVGVIGSNGAGKSSTLKALAGLVRPATGKILFGGRSIAGYPAHKISGQGIALVPEGRWIFNAQTVEENILLGAHRRLQARDSIATDFDWVLTLFPRLRERLTQQAGLLSGGEQQMLAVARALISRPGLLIVDEISLGLAPIILDQLFEVLVDLNKQGLAILLVDQIASRTLAATHRTYVFEHGKIALSGLSRELVSDPRVVDSYLGRHDA